MLTILGSLIGFLTSHAGEVMRLWQDKNHKKHALDLLDKQIELQSLKHEQKVVVAQINTQAEETKALYKHASLPSQSKWIDALRASVRPVITYSFFLLFVVIKISTLVVLMRKGSDFFSGIMYLWDAETKALFATVIVFWFGHRALLKNRERM